ncbi:MAG: hypothetical protein GVY34_01795 [Alphaproteobacteria bacterium]|nr:hypothetical protein [Alphaproteobacteria bacterium]
MRAEEIKDAESLQAWLESLPQETEAERETARRWAVTIAHRAAMRVLPVAWEWYQQQETAKKPVSLSGSLLRRSLLANLVAFSPSEEILECAQEERKKALYRSAMKQDGQKLEIALSYAVAASDASKSFFDAIDGCSASVDSHATRLNSEQFKSGLWTEIRLDCKAIWQQYALDRINLWRNPDPFNQLWDISRSGLLKRSDGWRFWVEWYENALYGRPQDYDLLTKIALIDPADWDKGADHVNALIAQIRLEHIAETRPLGEDAIEIGPDGLWHRAGKSDIDGDILEEVVGNVRDEIWALRSRIQGDPGNMFSALVADLDLLEHRIARHPDKPLRLHDLFIRVQGHIARNLDSGELPDDDCVRDLSSVLGNAALDMCNACDKTKSVVQKRMAVRFDEADEQTRDDLKTIAEGAAQISDDELATEFIEDAEVIADEAIPLSEKTSTLYRLQTRLARIVSKDGKNLVDALRLIGAMGSGVGVLAWITMTLLRFIIGA